MASTFARAIVAPEAAAGMARLAGRPANAPAEPVRVMRILTRMNIGGPAYHVSVLGGRMDPRRYSTLLVHGEVGPGEESIAELAQQEGCDVEFVPSLGPAIRPAADLRALVELIRIVRRFRPDIVETHTAKAGTLGRLAAWLAGRPRPRIVHIYHGHVLGGDFGRPMTFTFTQIERGLARISDCVVGVSQGTVDELVERGVAPRDAFRVVPLALDLERFAALSRSDGAAFREHVGARVADVLLVCACRLVHHKRVDLLLRVVSHLRDPHPAIRLAVLGDGADRPELERLADELGLSDVVAFVGYTTDVAPALAAADVVVLGSQTEGTPVFLIEAAAAGVPCVATRVGGTPEVVPPDAGILVPPRDVTALGRAIARLADDAALRERMGRNARAHARERFAVEGALSEHDALYRDLLGGDRGRAEAT